MWGILYSTGCPASSLLRAFWQECYKTSQGSTPSPSMRSYLTFSSWNKSRSWNPRTEPMSTVSSWKVVAGTSTQWNSTNPSQRYSLPNAPASCWNLLTTAKFPTTNTIAAQSTRPQRDVVCSAQPATQQTSWCGSDCQQTWSNIIGLREVSHCWHNSMIDSKWTSNILLTLLFNLFIKHQ